MKKTIALLLSLCLLLTFTACSRLPLPGKNTQAEDLSSKLASLQSEREKAASGSSSAESSSESETDSGSSESSEPENEDSGWVRPAYPAVDPVSWSWDDFMECSNPVGDDFDRMTNFLYLYTSFYAGKSAGWERFYDCKMPMGGSENDPDLLTSLIGNASCADWSLYPVEQPEYHWSDGSSDPRGWCEEYDGSWMEIPVASVQWVAAHIFHVTEADYLAMEAQKDGKGPLNFYYREGDSYYCAIGGIGDPLMEIIVGNCSGSENGLLILEYKYSNMDDPGDFQPFMCVGSFEEIEGERYFTVFYSEYQG